MFHTLKIDLYQKSYNTIIIHYVVAKNEYKMYIIPLCYFNTTTFLVVNLFFYIISVPLKWDTNDPKHKDMNLKYMALSKY